MFSHIILHLLLIYFLLNLDFVIAYNHMGKNRQIRRILENIHYRGRDMELYTKTDLETEIFQDTFRGSNNYLVKSGIGIKLEASPALVLNADFTPLSHMPLSLWYWQDALKAVLTGKASVVTEYNIRIRSVRQEFALPSVIALTEYQKVPTASPPLSRRNIYLRDGFRCQYCLMSLPPDGLTLDHVIPRSKGGKLTWTNTVSACRTCNVRKSDHMPEDLPRLGMRLKNVPRVPTNHELQARAKNLRSHRIHPDWEAYIS